MIKFVETEDSMIATNVLREQIKKYIDRADEKSLRMVKAILEIEAEYDFWDGLPEVVKNDVDEALVEIENGLGKSHEEVSKKYNQWRTK